MTQTQNPSPTPADAAPPNPAFYAAVVKLSPVVDGWVPATQGRLVHGAFLNLIQAVDPALSAALHSQNRRRPFTLSPLQGDVRAKNGQIRVQAGQKLQLRFTLLTGHLFTTFTRYLLTPPTQNSPKSEIGDGKSKIQNPKSKIQNLPTLRLGEVEFLITELLATPGSDPWAGYTTAADLCRRWQTAGPEEAGAGIDLEFSGGVVFNRSSDKDGLGRFMEFFPSPAMFFGSVAARWSELTGLPLPLPNKDLRAYAEETVVVSAFDMKTRLCHYWGKPQIGAVGRISYEPKDTTNLELARFLNLLADFAFYSGVGAKTAMGMGMVRRIKN